MHKLLKTAAFALALAGATLATAATASARPEDRHQATVGVTLYFRDVAIGYRDGYWDHRHNWHHWKHRGDAVRYRDSRRGEYYDWDHTRDRDQGWHDRDREDRQNRRNHNEGDRHWGGDDRR